MSAQQGYVIFDLDGCISDDRHRKHLLPDYDAYHALCKEDPATNHEVVERHVKAAHQILIVTGRCVSQADVTKWWLIKNYPDIKIKQLLMRPPGDTTPAVELKLRLLKMAGYHAKEIVAAYDDRCDIIKAYDKWGVFNAKVLTVPTPGVPSILREMALTYEDRNRVYGDNWKMVAPIIKILFPKGVPTEIVTSHQWHLFELKIVKLSRFAISNLTHVDSIHDDAVYSAMIESILKTEEQS